MLGMFQWPVYEGTDPVYLSSHILQGQSLLHPLVRPVGRGPGWQSLSPCPLSVKNMVLMVSCWGWSVISVVPLYTCLSCLPCWVLVFILKISCFYFTYLLELNLFTEIIIMENINFCIFLNKKDFSLEFVIWIMKLN